MTLNKPYFTDITQWYHPEIDYFEMLKNLRITKSSYHNKETLPLQYVHMMDYCGAWKADRKKREQQLFQFWNKQFLNEIAKIIHNKKPRLVLDVCAGDGLLARALQARSVRIKAVDTYEWPFKTRYFPVEKMDYKTSIETYQPDFIIGCWMPLSTDWTPDFRNTPSINHYMIIGEGEGGCCGGDWQEHTGWKKRLCTKATTYALCRTDSLIFDKKDSPTIMREMLLFPWNTVTHSSVYLFSRK